MGLYMKERSIDVAEDRTIEILLLFLDLCLAS